MLGLNICEIPLPLTEEAKVKIANSVSNYILNNWDEAVSIEIVGENAISVEFNL